MDKFYFIIALFAMAVFLIAMLYYLGVKTERLLAVCHISLGKKYTALALAILFVVLFVLKSALLGIMFYMIFLFFLCDIIKAVLKLFEKEGKVLGFAGKIYANGMFVFWMSVLITIFAAYNAKNPVVKEYVVQVDKEMEGDLNILMISDVHAGNSTKKKQFDRMLDMVNKEHADIICLCGDIFDESSSDEMIAYAFETFSKMKSTYGIYYVKGNHDYLIAEEQEEEFKKAGIIVLNDETVLVDERFYLVGRIDERAGERKELDTLLEKTEDKYPIIVLDHRPENLTQVKASTVSLQLSGHTHTGQLVPGNLFVGLFNDLTYGYKKYKDVNVIVSSGFGTWGLPIRTGSHSEIVKVILQGKH